jgi:hypothetical protein
MFSALLHPKVDPTDKYDPTFLGITRKRRISSPKRVGVVQTPHQGKFINKAMMAHDEHALGQLPENAVLVEGGTHPNVMSNRFGKGFQRRHVSSIGTEAHRDLEAQRETHRKEALFDARRAHHLEKHGPKMNPLTGGPPIIGTFCPPPPPLVSASRATAIANSRSTIFSAPAATTTASQALRLQRLTNEGLTTTKKEWSVKQQLSCFDGFEMQPTSSSSSGGGPLKPVRTPAVSTRPW